MLHINTGLGHAIVIDYPAIIEALPVSRKMFIRTRENTVCHVLAARQILVSRLLHACVVVCGAVPTAFVVRLQGANTSLFKDGAWSGQGRHSGHEANENSGSKGVLHGVGFGLA